MDDVGEEDLERRIESLPGDLVTVAQALVALRAQVVAAALPEDEHGALDRTAVGATEALLRVAATCRDLMLAHANALSDDPD